MHRSLLLALLASSTLSAALAEPVAGTVVLDQQFRGLTALPAGWRVEGGHWRVEQDRLVGVAREYLSTIVLPVGQLGNVALEANVAFLTAADPARWLALVVRKQTAAPRAFATFTHRFDRRLPSGIELGVGQYRGTKLIWDILARGSADIAPVAGEPHRLRVEARGEIVRGYLDGRLVLHDELPAECLGEGEVGLVVSSVTAAFESVRVARLPALTDAERRQMAIEEATSGRALPLIVAHRGNSAHAPENTVAAFREAFDAGADMVETDLRATRDGELVLLHDNTVERTTGSPAGALSAMSFAHVRQLDAGKWKGAQYAGQRIPTFDEALEVAKGRGSLLLDIKAAGLGEKLAAAVKRRGMEHDVVLAPWSIAEAQALRKHLPATPTVLIGSAPKQADAAWFAPVLSAGLHGFNYAAGSLSPDFVRAAARRGLVVYAWTVNERSTMRRMARLGVTGVLTDDPALLRQVLTEHAVRRAR